jgi:hypothetical protein
MSLDNNCPSSNLSPDPTTSALGGNHYLLDLGSSVKLQAASDLTLHPIYCRIKTERKHMITQKQYNEMLDSFNDEDWKNILFGVIQW